MRSKAFLAAAISAAASAAVTLLVAIPLSTSALSEPAPKLSTDPSPQVSPRLSTKLLRWEEAQVTRDAWGEFRRFFAGEGYAVKDALAAFAVVQPGKALHESHRHAEEEFLVIAEGSGTWSIAGKEVPLKKGDVLYVEPWVSHGCTNTSKEPLTFFVVRWNGKGVPVPPEPVAEKREPAAER